MNSNLLPETITFLWTINGQSGWEDNFETKYSIRSVEKFHPNNPIATIGYKPSWYGEPGQYFEHKESSRNGYINVWGKILAACYIDEISDPFIQMNDDFYLLRELEYLHYAIQGQYFLPTAVSTHWHKAKIETSKVIEMPCQNYCIHAPLLIDKQTFIECSEKYDWKSKSLIARQIYGLEVTKKKIFNTEFYPFDVKLQNARAFKPEERFFSIFDNPHEFGINYVLNHRYPNPSRVEQI